MKAKIKAPDLVTVEAAAIKMLDLRKQIKALESEAEMLRDLVLSNVEGQYIGTACVISVSDCERESLDKSSLEKALGKDFLKKHLKVSKYKKVDVVVK